MYTFQCLKLPLPLPLPREAVCLPWQWHLCIIPSVPWPALVCRSVCVMTSACVWSHACHASCVLCVSRQVLGWHVLQHWDLVQQFALSEHKVCLPLVSAYTHAHTHTHISIPLPPPSPSLGPSVPSSLLQSIHPSLLLSFSLCLCLLIVCYVNIDIHT